MMSKDKYTLDGEDITCSVCEITAREFFENMLKEKDLPPNWFNGNTWYCSDDCYDEATKYE